MKTFLSIIIFSLFSMGGFSQTPDTMKKGMIKVSVIYPNSEGKSFNMAYYTEKHLPFVAGLLGKALQAATAEKGLGGAEPGSKAPYIAMGNMYFNSLEDFQNAFGPNAEKIMADLPNFTDIKPVIQISQVML